MEKKKILDISLSVGLPLILYAVFFTPSFTKANEVVFSTSGAISGILLETLKITVTLFALILAAKVRLTDTGLFSFELKDFYKVLKGIVLIMFIYTAFALIFISLGQRTNVKTRLETSYLIAGVMMLFVGYCEELFFRIYAFESFRRFLSRNAAALISAIIFCCGHFYEGYIAVVVIFFLGLAFQFIYIKYKSIHVNAIVHALFNMISLAMSTSINSSL